MVLLSHRFNRNGGPGGPSVSRLSLLSVAQGGEGPVGVGVHPQLAADDLQDGAVLRYDEGDPLGGGQAEAALDAEPLADAAVRVGQQRHAEVVAAGELLLLLDGVTADAHGPGAGGRELRRQVTEVAGLR